MARYRKKMSRRASKRSFSRTASMTHRKNLATTSYTMRGGTRM